MTMLDERIDPGDYVLVPKRKAQISRARKGLIGLMVVGAIAALGGAGSFASFSASTDNAATFSTGAITLANSVAAETSIFNGLGKLGPNNDLVKQLTLTTAGDYGGDLYLYASDACVDDIVDSSALCEGTTVTVERSNGAGGWVATNVTDVALDDFPTVWNDGTDTVAFNLGTLPATAATLFRVTASLTPPAGDEFVAATGAGALNAVQGKSVTAFTLHWLLQADTTP